MLVSIIVPIYNADKYLENCLTSLINQTYSNLEIILIDDGSFDETAKICKTFCEKHSNIKYYYQKNSGQSIARNKGLLKSKGEYISFVDADDSISSEMIEKLYSCAKKNDSDIVICGINYCYHNHTRKIIPHNVDNPKEKILDPLMSSVCNKLYRKAILKDIIFEKIKYEDLLFNTKLYFSTDRIDNIYEPLYFYNRTNENSTISKISFAVLDIFKVLNIINNTYVNTYDTKYSDELEYLNIYYTILTKTVYVLKQRNKILTEKFFIALKKHLNNEFPLWYDNKYLINESFKNKMLLFYVKIKLKN